ncbi:hypothetical protein [Actinoplanes sp. NPDC089786]|uniref:hypothetical protein n=1 Tax=Actinoplanes sp. NPDC089786 TaxID=3155185 RepID=UPI00341E3DBD
MLTVWPWTTEILQQWIGEVRPRLTDANSPAMWPTERGPRISVSAIDRRMADYRRSLGLLGGLDFHSLRRS